MSCLRTQIDQDSNRHPLFHVSCCHLSCKNILLQGVVSIHFKIQCPGYALPHMTSYNLSSYFEFKVKICKNATFRKVIDLAPSSSLPIGSGEEGGALAQLRGKLIRFVKAVTFTCYYLLRLAKDGSLTSKYRPRQSFTCILINV